MAVNINLRKPLIVKNPQYTPWSTASFNINRSGDNTTIKKDRLSTTQLTQYIDLTKVVDTGLEIDIDNYGWLNQNPSNFNFNTQTNMNFATVTAKTFNGANEVANNIETYAIFDGYKDITTNYLLDNSKRLVKEGTTYFVPFINKTTQNIEVTYSNGTQVNATNPTYNSTESQINYVNYVLIPNNSNMQNSSWVDLNFNGDVLRLYKNTIDTSGQDVVNIYFKNCFGVLEKIQMNGRYKDSVSVDSSNYRRSTIDINGDSIGDNKHTNKVYNKVGEREWEVNTGIIPEYMNSALESLIMSEEVWLEKDGVIRAVELTDTSFNKKIQIEELIDYSFTFKEDKKINE